MLNAKLVDVLYTHESLVNERIDFVKRQLPLLIDDRLVVGFLLVALLIRFDLMEQSNKKTCARISTIR